MESIQHKVDNVVRVACRYNQAFELPEVPRLNGMLRARHFTKYFDELDDLILHARQEGIHRFRALSNMKAFLSKNPLLADHRKKTCDRNAFSTWEKAERLCSRTNKRIRLTAVGRIGSQYNSVLERARRKIHAILGATPSWVCSGRHGPGSSIGLTGVATSASFKDAAIPYSVTHSCYNLFTGLLSFSEGWLWGLGVEDPSSMTTSDWVKFQSESLKVVADCNKMSFVPKNWKTSRTIGVEPLGNMYVQLALGDEIALKLRRVGIDIRDQTRNRDLARRASLHLNKYGDDFVTLDLSMASDTLSRELVKFLVPEKWYLALNSARCQSTQLPSGSVVRLSKFSSMGNGFTFPLETLIFYALAYASVYETQHRSEISAYGDDIIVPRGSALYVTEVFRWCGFVVNRDKSCIFGDFYESCGADYLRGHFVRPLYVKRNLDSVRDYYYILNSLRKYAPDMVYSSGGRDFYNHMLSRCDGNLLFGPRPESKEDEINLVDTHIHTSSPALLRFEVEGWCYYYKRYSDSAKSRYLDDRFLLIDVLRRGSPGILRSVSPKLPGHSSCAIKLTRSKVKWVSCKGITHTPDEIDKLIEDLVRV